VYRVPVRYRRVQRGQFLQKLQHAIPSVVVLSDGISHLQHDPHGVSLALGLAEVVVSALVIGSVIRGLRQLRAGGAADHGHAKHGVDWIDLFLGAMLLVEAYAKYHATHHLPRPTILMGVAMIAIGLMHGRIATWGERRLQLRVDDDGISVPGRFFRRLSLPWSQVAEITVGPATARVIALDGRDQELNLRDAINADAIRDALAEARTRLAAYRIAQANESGVTAG
jgi:hypothetical protein